MRIWLGLVAAFVICFSAAGIGGWFTGSSVTGWYASLTRPAWSPPDAVFGPVWTVLYLAMAVAAWLVWRHAGFAGAQMALGLFALQLVLNVAWSAIFFGLRNPAAAFVEIVVLWIALAGTVVAFWRILPVAGVIMVPYLAWVTFAAVLNFAVWSLNR
jgi:tryptophan-rich sensory protein